MFRRRRKKRKPIPHWLAWISEGMYGLALSMSRHLQVRVNRTPPRRVRFVVMLMLAGLLGANVAILLRAINRTHSVTNEPIRMPKRVLPDSVLKARPGLVDSIRRFQKLNP
jgi:hypothetical protein